MNKITLSPVTSSHIAKVGYDEETRTLMVEFHSGDTFKYWPVTPQGYRDFISAPSLGKYFHQHIIKNDIINYEKVS